MIDDTLDSAADDLAEAKAKIDATRAALLTSADNPTIRQALARLDRIVAELEKVEEAVSQPVAHDARN